MFDRVEKSEENWRKNFGEENEILNYLVKRRIEMNEVANP